MSAPLHTVRRPLPPRGITEAELDAAIRLRFHDHAEPGAPEMIVGDTRIVRYADLSGCAAPAPAQPIDTPELLADVPEPARLPWLRRHRALALTQLCVIALYLASSALSIGLLIWLFWSFPSLANATL